MPAVTRGEPFLGTRGRTRPEKLTQKVVTQGWKFAFPCNQGDQPFSRIISAVAASRKGTESRYSDLNPTGEADTKSSDTGLEICLPMQPRRSALFPNHLCRRRLQERNRVPVPKFPITRQYKRAPLL